MRGGVAGWRGGWRVLRRGPLPGGCWAAGHVDHGLLTAAMCIIWHILFKSDMSEGCQCVWGQVGWNTVAGSAPSSGRDLHSGVSGGFVPCGELAEAGLRVALTRKGAR